MVKTEQAFAIPSCKRLLRVWYTKYKVGGDYVKPKKSDLFWLAFFLFIATGCMEYCVLMIANFLTK